MLLNTYQNNIVSIIQKYVDNGYIMSFNFSVDTKSNYIGFIQGSLEFLQGSQLFFREYVDLQEFIEKLSYSFHYQDQYNNLIFRYDNAQHKPDLGYSEHKHIRDKIMPSKIPEIEQVILEIINEYLEI
jgi:septum formation topological specificity factor MinE